MRENVQVNNVQEEARSDQLKLEFSERQNSQEQGFSVRPRDGQPKVFRGNCYGCQMPGHRLRDCRVAKPQQIPQLDQVFSSFLQSMKAFFDQQISKEPQAGQA